MAKVKKSVPTPKKLQDVFTNYWSKTNIILTVLAVVLLTIGYILMSQGPWDNPVSLTISPIILVFTYVIVIPIAILFFGKKQSLQNKENAE